MVAATASAFVTTASCVFAAGVSFLTPAANPPAVNSWLACESLVASGRPSVLLRQGAPFVFACPSILFHKGASKHSCTFASYLGSRCSTTSSTRSGSPHSGMQ